MNEPTDEEIERSIEQMETLSKELEEHIEICKLYKNGKTSYESIIEAVEESEYLGKI